MEGPTQEWLERLNAEFGANNVPHRLRSWRAWDRWTQERRVSLPFDHPIAKYISSWFAANTKPGSEAMPPLYQGAFFFDGEFWLLNLPVMFGTVRLNGLDCIPSMPPAVKGRLAAEPSARDAFTRTFTDFVEVALGLERVTDAAPHNAFCASLLKAADQKLSTLAPLLAGTRPQVGMLEPAGLTVELFLKAFLGARDGLTDADAKNKYRHHLAKLLGRCQEVAPELDLSAVAANLEVFPEMGARYAEIQAEPAVLWRAYSCALSTGALVTRALFGSAIVLRPDQLQSA